VSILRGPDLDYDLSGFFNRQSTSGFRSFNVVNGLTLNARLSQTWSVQSRVAYQLGDPGSGQESQWQWSASLVARPLTTLYGALTYSGQRSQFLDHSVDPPQQATSVLQSISLFGRADLYEGVSLQANLSGTNTLDQNLRAINGLNGNATLALIPNRWVSLTTGYTYSVAFASGGFLPDDVVETARINGTLIIQPIPALSASATIDWLIVGLIPGIYSTFQVNYAPLQGDLQVGFIYARTLDTASRNVTQFISPNLRWTIRPGVFLNGAYSINDTDGPVLRTHAQIASASLVIIL
jgi:hypothetical protein